MSESLGEKAAQGAIWATVDRFGSMTIQFVVNLILARLLLPADFGMIGMLTIFITVSQALIDGGFGSALIQKKDPTQSDYSTIFFWNLIFSTVMYLVLFVSSPLIAKFYDMPMLSKVLRVLSLSLIFSSIFAIQRTRLQKMLAFKTIAVINLSASSIGAVVTIFLAYIGFGVWSLVVMQITYGIISVFLLGIITRWHPSFIFSKSAFRDLFGFGGYIMAAYILQVICQNLQGVIIGKRFSATQMGYFSQAYKLDQITSYSIPQVIVQVMYPIYSSLQDDRERLNRVVEMNMRVISFIVFPILGLLILISDPLISFLYGDKWLPAVPYFQILCLGGFFVCLQNLNFYAVAAVGKSKTLFRWSFYKWGFLGSALLIGMNFGMYGILWGMVLSNINIFMVNAYIVSKFTGLKISKQLGAIIPVMILTLLCMALAYGMSYLGLNLIISGIMFICLIIVLSIGLKIKAGNDFLMVAAKFLKRERN